MRCIYLTGGGCVAKHRRPVQCTQLLHAGATFLSIKLTFLSIKLTFLSIKLTFLSIKLTFLSQMAQAFHVGTPVRYAVDPCLGCHCDSGANSPC